MIGVAADFAGPTTQDGHDASTGKVVPTLLTVMKVMRDEPFRLRLVEALGKNPVLGESLTRHVIEFLSVAQRATGDRSFANMGSYIVSKLTRMTDNRVLRNMLCGGKRTVDFRALMDSNRILLVNLGKGQIGNQDARMLGMLISKYLFHAAMTRADIARKRRTPFYLYLDEFQNFATTEMTEVLSEARKFGLHLVLAHQTLSQISQRDQDGLLQSVLGNVATQLFLRVGVDEAKTLERMIQPRFDASILAQLPDRHAIARLLVDNRPTPPFVMRTHEPLRMAKGSAARAGHARKASHARYGVEEVL